jgi:hypothetical protein
MTAAARMASDRLYSVFFRPQELALYGDNVRFELSYSPIVDDIDEPTEQHYRLLVLEATVIVPDDEGVRPQGEELPVLKCGWELELHTPQPQAARDVGEVPGELRFLLGRIADLINELAKRAGLEAPLLPELLDRLAREAAQSGASA